jgi:hypothetical protein
MYSALQGKFCSLRISGQQMPSQYTKMSSSESFEDERQDEQESLVNQQSAIHSWRFPKAVGIVILLLTLNLIGFVVVFASVIFYHSNGSCQSHESKLLTEFRKSPPRLSFSLAFSRLFEYLLTILESFPSLKEEVVKYSGGLAFTAPGKMYRTGIEGLPKYVGEPTEEIDANWDLLVDGKAFQWIIRFKLTCEKVQPVNITREEALQIGGEFYYFPCTDIAQIEYVSEFEGIWISLTVDQGFFYSYVTLPCK